MTHDIDNRGIAHIFNIMAAIMMIKGENPYRIRAYERAAEAIVRLPRDLSVLHRAGQLQDIPGIGQTLRDKIETLLTTGSLPAYERLLESIPPGLVDMLELPNVGPKTVKLLYENLDIEDVEQLEKAALAGKIRSLPGMGVKKEANILRGIAAYRNRSSRMLLSSALVLAENVQEHLKKEAGRFIEEMCIAGSVRRGKETVGDIDILVASGHPASLMDVFVNLPDVDQVIARGETKCSVLTHQGPQVDLRVIEPRSFGAALQYFTGSKSHNVRVRERASHRNLKINEYGVFDRTGSYIGGETEAQVYQAIALPFIPPELREDRGEINAAEAGILPNLIKEEELRGDLHMHTSDSDGIDDLETMARAAQNRGYEYIAITDHSVSLRVAGGLSADRLLAQAARIRKLNNTLAPFKILTGTEVNINADGTLDLPNEVLAKLDVVVASVHTGLGQDRATLTRRILRALTNPYVTVFAHPTGRLLRQREPAQLDLDKLLDAAKREDVALEINSQPDRLDLPDIWVLEAKKRGVDMVISSDAHNSESLDTIRFGVITARRGWLEKKDALNTLSLQDLLNRLDRTSIRP